MATPTSLANHLLIAMPSLTESTFEPAFVIRRPGSTGTWIRHSQTHGQLAFQFDSGR